MLPTKILLISADDSMSKSVITSLSGAGYRIMHTSRGAGALDLIKIEKPALVILDIALPDYNSLSIIRALRSGGQDNRLPVILIGSNMHEGDVLLGLEIGADLCLLETFHPQVFIARVRSLLRRSEVMKIH